MADASDARDADDLALIAAANRGDGAAFARLYEQYRDWVTALAFRLTGDRELALDVLQETFTYFLGKFPGFELHVRMKTFLYPVVRHTAISVQQRARRDAPRGHESVAEDHAEVPRGAAEHAGLDEALDRLPIAQREVLILRYVDELALSEIAVALGLPLGTVKSRLHHAHQAVRVALDP